MSNFCQKPPQSRVITAWYLEEAVKNLTNSLIKKADVKKLFLKTLFVVAVASSNRLVELAAVAREDINVREDSGKSTP